MSAHNFMHLSNIANDPRRAEQLRIAGTIDLAEITAPWQRHDPPGSCGFRKGHWTREYRGKKYTFFSCVPHAAELAAQEEMVRRDAALHIAGVMSGYIREK